MAKKDRYQVNSVIASKITTDVKFRVEEAYKTARTNLAFSIMKDGCKKIVITSSETREGKTTTSVNLAISLAEQIDTKVLLIDCDLRKPRVDQFFDIPNLYGLTDYLVSSNTLEEVMCRTEVPNLTVIFSGLIPPNPSEILASDKMKKFIDEMEKRFDYIVIDTPPINLVVDALPLARISDGVIVVTKQGYSRHPEIQKAVDTLNRFEVKVLGFIMNGYKDKHKEKGYSYDYKYN